MLNVMFLFFFTCWSTSSTPKTLQEILFIFYSLTATNFSKTSFSLLDFSLHSSYLYRSRFNSGWKQFSAICKNLIMEIENTRHQTMNKWLFFSSFSELQTKWIYCHLVPLCFLFTWDALVKLIWFWNRFGEINLT